MDTGSKLGFKRKEMSSDKQLDAKLEAKLWHSDAILLINEAAQKTGFNQLNTGTWDTTDRGLTFSKEEPNLTLAYFRINGIPIGIATSGVKGHSEDIIILFLENLVATTKKRNSNAILWKPDEDCNENLISIHITKSPCSSDLHDLNMVQSVLEKAWEKEALKDLKKKYKKPTFTPNSEKSEGCTQRLIKIEQSGIDGYKFHFRIKAAKLYGVSYADLLCSACAVKKIVKNQIQIIGWDIENAYQVRAKNELSIFNFPAEFSSIFSQTQAAILADISKIIGQPEGNLGGRLKNLEGIKEHLKDWQCVSYFATGDYNMKKWAQYQPPVGHCSQFQYENYLLEDDKVGKRYEQRYGRKMPKPQDDSKKLKPEEAKESKKET